MMRCMSAFGLRPRPAHLYAPFVRRDKVFGNQDNLIIWIDPTGARKFAQFFQVNPVACARRWHLERGQHRRDFSPDFDFKRVPARHGGRLERGFRIPWHRSGCRTRRRRS